MLVLPSRVAIGCRSHLLGTIYDIVKVREMRECHKTQSDKVASDIAMPHYGPLRAEHTNSWAIFTDKSYIGSTNLLLVIHPRRKPAVGKLRSEDEQNNSKNIEWKGSLMRTTLAIVCVMRCIGRKMALV